MRFIFLLLSLSFSLLAYAQNEANIWYFGNNAGLDFNSGTPVALADGEIITLEGCATISDGNGDLLFYTDGSTVYNANHNIMPNGFGLNGNSTSSQSAIIVKKPGTTNIYTIFTVDAFAGLNGFQYSEVDMTLDGGLGDVVATVKNIPVYAPTCEKVTAIAHSNGTDYWIVTHEISSVNFRTYLFDNSGLSATPITSVGDDVGSFAVLGYLKTNIQGTKIAFVRSSAAFGGSAYVKLYDFNNTTGAITNEIELPSPNSPYGVEFSPSGQYLYVSHWYGLYPLYQYDLNAGTGSETDIQNSQTTIATISNGGAMQIGPDQKIYVAMDGSTTLGTISSPDLAGALCDFDVNGMPLSAGTTSSYGLPTFFNNIVAPTTPPTVTFNICQGDSITLSNPDPTFTNHNWALVNDPTTVISTDPTITVSPLNDISYLLFNSTDTMQFNINVSQALNLNLGPDNCIAQDSVVLDVTNPDPDVTYEWQDGSDDPTFVVDSTGVYWVEISNGVCTERDSIFIQFETMLITGDEVVQCDSTVILNVADSNPQTGTWEYLAPPGGPQTVIFNPNENSINPTITVPELGEYIFMYTSECGFTDTHTVVFENLPPELDIAATQQCNFEIDLEASTNQNGHWTAHGPEGETVVIDDINAASTSATVSDYGLYTFTFTYDFCNASTSTTIDIQSIQPTITNTQDYYICEKTIQLNASVPGQQGSWSVEGPGIVTFTSFQNLNTDATVSEYGDYTFYYTGCGKTDTFDVTFTKTAPVVNAPTYVECATEALVEVQYYGDNIGTWSFEPGTTENITLTELDDNTVSISTDVYGEVDVTYTTCDTSTTVNIVFMCELDVPNVFTPNNDGINNEFTIKRLNTKYYDRSVFTVYDRWGVQVYTNGRYGLEGAWWNGRTSKNGEELVEGVYYYELHLHNKVNDLDETYKGTIHIFR